MNETVLLVQCGDMGLKWVPYYMHYYNKHWNCDSFIDTVFLFENNAPEMKIEKDNVYADKMGQVTWGQGMINWLNKVKYKYVILVHEDYFIVDYPDVLQVKRLIELMNQHNLQLLKICGDWAGNTETPKLPIGELTDKEQIYLYSAEGKYLTSQQPSIWNREYLLKTLVPNENPWGHELAGHERAKALGIPVHAYLGIAPIPIAECVTAGASRPGCEKYFEVKL